MKLPFLQHIGIGLHITGRAIRWVELSRMRDRLSIRNIDVEVIEDGGGGGNSKGDLKSSLSTLVERVNPSHPYVTVNLDERQVRQRVVDVPEFDDEEYAGHWLEEQIGQLMPEGLNPDEFITAHHFLAQMEYGQRCLLVAARKQAVDERRELLECAGLKPLIITTGHLQAGYGFIFDGSFTGGEARLISLFEDGSSLQWYRDGILANTMELSGTGASTAEMIDEAEAYLATEEGTAKVRERNMYLSASDYYAGGAADTHSPALSGTGIQRVLPLSYLSGKDNPLSGDYSIAAGMAVKQLYPALDGINLLEEERQEDARQALQKKDAIRSGILLGGSVVLLFMLLMAVQLLLSSKLEDARRQAVLLEDKITAVSEAKSGVSELKQRVDQAGKLVAGRTSMARALEIIGRSLSGRVWLNEVRINKTAAGKKYSIYGYAFNDALVASLMERLEQQESAEQVRLIYSETVSSEEVYREPSPGQETLVRFEIRMAARPAAGS